MAPNVGSTDRMVRYLLVVVFAVIALFFVAGIWKWVFGLLAVVMLVTATTNFCPIWAALGINTRRKAG
ncbi:MAG: YgaP family membrane protein [Deinococcota bacterium]|uniref:Inner membrane protein YgaP-like transmembrane domain-containing protein n=1 Tax=Allomeiothermus silvanus (strain ATCC 700542 / DSM 9946 / NBRC 106475 / NCIMB 13440 / VI-R2) TaxID=526227 RepID=D7BHK8_ALLS1|nr:DUF2892 domain-containing protein [Allomeiothermus silvanus]ADH62246.1 conserved hypothetical protein [Allomeiothermus silvanus DSM 9946]